VSADKEKGLSFREDAERKMEEKKLDIGSSILDMDDMFREVTKLYSEKLEIKTQLFKKRENKFNVRIRELERVVERLTPKEVDYQFPENYGDDKEKIVVEIYTIKSLDNVHLCPYCDAFEEEGYVDLLEDLGRILNLEKAQFVFKIWEVDYAERFSNSNDHPNYSMKMSMRGKKFYYAIGWGVNKFPAIDIWVHFKKGKVKRKNQKEKEFFRIKGLGTIRRIEDGEIVDEIQFGEFEDDLFDFLRTMDNSKMVKLPQHIKSRKD
jgi:hypothetical protein